jgi:hypothetical protein
MFGRWEVLFLICFCAAFGTANGQSVKADIDSVRFFVDGCFYSGDSRGGVHQVLTAYLINYTNDTLKYLGTNQRFKDLFSVSGSDALVLANDTNVEPLFEQMTIPPHRSKQIELKLSTAKKPQGTITLIVRLKLYKWFSSNDFENDLKFHQPKVLSDKISFTFLENGLEYYTADYWAEKEKKDKLILPDIDLYLLTDRDRKILTVTVDENKISNPIDSVYDPMELYSKKSNLIKVPVIVHNYGDDTLKYLSMTCSWNDYYHVDNKMFNVYYSVCEFNTPCYVTVPPHGIQSEILEIIYDEKNLKDRRFKVGVNINKDPLKHKPVTMFEFSSGFQLRNNNIVWSNEIELKHR